MCEVLRQYVVYGNWKMDITYTTYHIPHTIYHIPHTKYRTRHNRYIVPSTYLPVLPYLKSLGTDFLPVGVDSHIVYAWVVV